MSLIERGFIKRNRKVLLISLAIFVVFAVASALAGFFMIGDDYGAITNAINEVSSENGGAMESSEDILMRNETLEFFVHNLSSDLIVVVGGLLFSVISVIVAAYNAVCIGYPFGMDFTFAAVSILPHGIIEYASTVIALAAAFNITKLEIEMIRKRSIRDVLSRRRAELKDILVMIVIVVILLLVAAIIEGNVTGLVISWFYGL
jgi:uncharacterized membrane protein SpoIIM required for sporulation